MNRIKFAALWIMAPNDDDVAELMVRLYVFDPTQWCKPFTGALWTR